MRNLISFIILLFSISTVYSNKVDETLYKELLYTLDNKQKYENDKIDRIDNIKKLKVRDTSLEQEYNLNLMLHQEYRIFQLDSAVYYAERNCQIAENLGFINRILEAKLYLSWFYSMLGMSVDAKAILSEIDASNLPENLYPLYYETYLSFFGSYMANSLHDYSNEYNSYRDLFLSVIDPQSFSYKINNASKKAAEGKDNEAESDLLIMLSQEPGYTHQYAMITHNLAYIYKRRGETELEKKYFTLSAIADLQNAVKENASVRMLALIYYTEGNIEMAYRLMQSAIEDAVFGNVQFRTVQLSQFYSIVNTAYLEREMERKNQLKLYIFLISLLTIFLAIAILYVYKQMKKVSRIKEEIASANKKLVELNNDILQTNKQLNEKNDLLYESNHIKEEYIAHFFDLCSSYINKFEDYRRMLNKKAASNQLDELYNALKSTSFIEDELQELYNNFDHIFLNLYPNFVEEFNALLVKDEQVVLKPGEVLNTELRIFALVRLGITDSVKIAAFLRYSLSTIYNYRTKMRNKASVSRDDFEKKVMKIGLIPQK
ncbi:DUF6377 domain-containing protein [Bacteroidales bacterium OttesenSCG-928-I14]|nr:DUF6377 domain-containing protein [Bacteroidales bacterium OttesenSCG-928-I14]